MLQSVDARCVSFGSKLISLLKSAHLGHANCVKFVKSFNKPLLMLGGGGYTMRNVSRAWAFETGLAAGVELGAGAYFRFYTSTPTAKTDLQDSYSGK